MKIAGYSMELTGSSTFHATESEHMNLKVWTGSFEAGNQSDTKGEQEGIILNLSPQGKKLAYTSLTKESDAAASLTPSAEDVPDETDFKQRLLSDFIYILTGKRLKFANIKLKNTDPNASTPGIAAGNLRAGWGIDLSYEHSYKEESTVAFSAKGSVRTADGREIDLELNLNMSRSFYSQTNLSFKAGDALLDPLVVNLGSTPAALSGKKISFDINVDGSNEKIFVPGASSGFLVLDKNKNGKIDDGRELFGPQTGNGFEELAGYDSDNNGWIDENDPIYNNLQIWQHDEYGNSTLIAIGKAGVGAIYLGSAQTDYKYADARNDTQGMLRRTGIYLNENGTPCTIQHIDLVV